MNDDNEPAKKGPGYPPVEHRFQKGTSGNRLGRPLGSKNKKKRDPMQTLSDQITIEEAYRKVRSSDGELPALTALIRAQLLTAAKGSPLAQRYAIERIMEVEQRHRDEKTTLMMNAERYKQLHEELKIADPAWVAQNEHRLIPHPDDIEIDWTKREVRILGPADRVERKVWQQGLDALAKMKAMVFELRREVEAEPENPELHLALLHCTHRFMCSNDKLPERYRMRRLPIWKKGKSLPMPEIPDRPRRNLRRASR